MNTIYSSSKKSGFTIVELLIVIVVIGILTAISVVAYTGIQERSRVSRANSDLATLVKSIRVARLNTNKTLMGVTGNGCTRCATDPAVYIQTIDRIAIAAGVNLASIKQGDPWGNNYIIDENEGESIALRCTVDSLGVSGSRPGVNPVTIPLYGC